jgi:S-adenosylhomocysteine hydrolase
MLTWPGEPANMILDDGGDATMLVLRGAQYEKAGVVPPTEDDDSDEWKVFLALVRSRFETDKTKCKWTKNDEYDNEVYRLAKHLDEKVAKIHVEALGGSLTRLTKEQPSTSTSTSTARTSPSTTATECESTARPLSVAAL